MRAGHVVAEAGTAARAVAPQAEAAVAHQERVRGAVQNVLKAGFARRVEHAIGDPLQIAGVGDVAGIALRIGVVDEVGIRLGAGHAAIGRKGIAGRPRRRQLGAGTDERGDRHAHHLLVDVRNLVPIVETVEVDDVDDFPIVRGRAVDRDSALLDLRQDVALPAPGCRNCVLRESQRRDTAVAAGDASPLPAVLDELIRNGERERREGRHDVQLRALGRIPKCIVGRRAERGLRVVRVVEPQILIARREAAIHVVKALASQGELLEIVRALRATGRLARSLHRGKQECGQHSNDPDDDEQLDQRKGPTTPKRRRVRTLPRAYPSEPRLRHHWHLLIRLEMRSFLGREGSPANRFSLRRCNVKDLAVASARAGVSRASAATGRHP